MMSVNQRRNAWIKHCQEQIELRGIHVLTLPSGAVRLIGSHNDITLTDLGELTPTELVGLTRRSVRAVPRLVP